MPLLNLYLNKKTDEAVSTKILSELSQLVAQSLGKPQDYMMVSILKVKSICPVHRMRLLLLISEVSEE
jgi:phenylpyruvate tautomerase PptA (4-oxalocrotonate tautomerase family)